MYTQCPECLTIYTIDEELLQSSLGIVRCGHCQERFDALRTLTDTLPPEPGTALPDLDPMERTPVLVAPVPASAFEEVARRKRARADALSSGWLEEIDAGLRERVPPGVPQPASNDEPAQDAPGADWFAEIESELATSPGAAVPDGAPGGSVDESSPPVVASAGEPDTVATKMTARTEPIAVTDGMAGIEPATAEPFAATEAPVTAEPLASAEPIVTADGIADAEPVAAAELFTATEVPVTAEPLASAEPIVTTDGIADAEPVATVEPSTATEAPVTAEPLASAIPIVIEDGIAGAEPVASVEPSTATEAPVTAEPLASAELIVTAKGIASTEPMANAKPVMPAALIVTTEPFAIAKPTVARKDIATTESMATAKPIVTAELIATLEGIAGAEPIANATPSATAELIATLAGVASTERVANAAPIVTAELIVTVEPVAAVETAGVAPGTALLRLADVYRWTGTPSSSPVAPGSLTGGPEGIPPPTAVAAGQPDAPVVAADAAPVAARVAAFETLAPLPSEAGVGTPRVDARGGEGADDPDEEVVEPAPVYVRPRRRRQAAHLAWAAACAALALVLAAQIAWAGRVALLRNPATRAFVSQWCRSIPCHLPPIKDTAQIELLSRDVRPDPDAAGVLMITATLRNDAPFRQPWPVVVVELTDVDNRVVAMRRFRPAEYMPDASRRATGLAAGMTAAVAFAVVDPGKRASGFRFGFE